MRSCVNSEANQMLLRLSCLDGLTGITNRRQFDDFLDQEWRRAVRELTPLSLIMLDIDRFKSYNESHGHTSGDECLKQVAAAISGAVNRPGDLVARLAATNSSSSFHGTRTDGAAQAGGNASGNGVSPSALRTPKVAAPLSAWALPSMIPSRNTSPTDLIKAADQRTLYQAKQEGPQSGQTSRHSLSSRTLSRRLKIDRRWRDEASTVSILKTR